MLGGDDQLRGRRAAPATQVGRHMPLRSETDRPTRKSFPGVLYGGAAGFLLGAAFWIALGLQELAGSSGAASLSPAREPEGVQVPAAGCTSLTLDRRQGHTTAEPCLGLLREARMTAPGDLSVP